MILGPRICPMETLSIMYNARMRVSLLDIADIYLKNFDTPDRLFLVTAQFLSMRYIIRLS